MYSYTTCNIWYKLIPLQRTSKLANSLRFTWQNIWGESYGVLGGSDLPTPPVDRTLHTHYCITSSLITLELTTAYYGFFPLQNIALEYIINVASWIPNATRPVMKFVFKAFRFFSPGNRVDVSDDVLLVPNYFPVHNQAEIAVGIEDCAAAMREVDRVVRELAIPVNFIIEVRVHKITINECVHVGGGGKGAEGWRGEGEGAEGRRGGGREGWMDGGGR